MCDNSNHFIFFKSFWMREGSNNSSHFIYFKKVWMQVGSNILSNLRGSKLEYESNNNNHFIYFERVWIAWGRVDGSIVFFLVYNYLKHHSPTSQTYCAA